MVKAEVKKMLGYISKIERKIKEVQACLFGSQYFRGENIEIINRLLYVTEIMLTNKKMEVSLDKKASFLRRLK